MNGYMTVKEASDYIGLKPWTIRGWIRDKKIPTYSYNGFNIRVKKEDLDSVMDMRFKSEVSVHSRGTV